MIKTIINKNQIILNCQATTKHQVFQLIAKQAKALNLVSSASKIVAGFKLREQASSTGFEDGFAIPHTRIEQVLSPAIFVVKMATPIDWDSIDHSLTDTIIALLIPAGDADGLHLEILSKIATSLINPQTKEKIKTSKTKQQLLAVFNTMDQPVKSPEPVVKNQASSTNQPKLKIVGITACVVGIAHTYMAEEKLLLEAKKQQIDMRIETQGSRGVGNQLTSEEISNADFVILATDTSIDQSRFVNKRVYQTKVVNAIKDPKLVIQKAQTEAKQAQQVDVKNAFSNTKKPQAQHRDHVLQHILVGIGYMIPIIVLGGICLAFSLGIAKAIWGAESGTSGPNNEYPNNPLAILDKIGGAAFVLMIPILAGFIANSIGGRAAIAPAMVGGFIGNDPNNFANWIPGLAKIQSPMGFIGAIIAGLVVGYYVKWVNSWKVPKSLAPAMPIFFIPLTAGIGISVVFIYVIGAPIGFVMDQISHGIQSAYSGQVGIFVGLMLGIVLGAMAGFDMGGPINKIAFVTCALLIDQDILQPMGAMSAAIPVAPIGMGLSTVLFKKFFNQDEQNLGIAAMMMGVIGISEGAIPFAIRDPKRAIICNVVGSSVAGGIAGALLITDAAAHGGPIVAILGAVPYGVMTLYYFIAVAAGVACTTMMYGLWLKKDAGEVGSVKAIHILTLANLQQTRHDQVKLAKKAVKEAKKQPNTHQLVKAIEALAELELYYQDKIKLVKQAYQTVVQQEKSFIKASDLKIQLVKINTNYRQKISRVRHHEYDDKASKHDQVMQLKKAKADEIDNLQISLRAQYKQMYLNQI